VMEDKHAGAVAARENARVAGATATERAHAEARGTLRGLGQSGCTRLRKAAGNADRADKAARKAAAAAHAAEAAAAEAIAETAAAVAALAVK
jgi:hypothetical protein